MNFYRLFALSIVMIAGFCAHAQDSTSKAIWPKLGKNDTIRVAATYDNGYMIPWIGLREVVIYGQRIWKSPQEQLRQFF